jgi:hypothetical protein
MMVEKIKGELGDDLADQTRTFLMSMDENPSFHDACSELLRQGAVLIWGSFEAFGRDLIVKFLDSHPSQAVDLLVSAEGRRLFGVRALDFEVLRETGFDLSRRMGRLLSQFHDLSTLPALRTVVGTLFPAGVELRDALGVGDLWLLSQRRHLIVHRRGVVDERYLDATGDSIAAGQHLSVSPSDLLAYLKAVRNAAAALLSAVEGSGEAQTTPR